MSTIGTGGPLINAPVRSQKAVTPSDSTPLAIGCRALKIGTDGNINVQAIDDAAPVVVAVNAGELYAVMATFVFSTSTTAGGIVALY